MASATASQAVIDRFVAACRADARVLAAFLLTLFVEDFGLAATVVFVLSDGTEAEVRVGREAAFTEIARGPHRVLLDKTGVLSGVSFVGYAADSAEQREELRRIIMWFWHDVSHFLAAMSRGKLWWAYGQLEILRRARCRQPAVSRGTGCGRPHETN